MKVFLKVKNFFGRIVNRAPPVGYKIGNIKFHNTLIDTLLPELVEIGDNFVSAPGSIILAHDASPLVHLGKYRVGRVRVGNNVFLGANAVILPGITIGDDVIVGAGAIVTRDVESGWVVAGNPARKLCKSSEYFKKCENTKLLVDAPVNYKKIFNNQRYTEYDIREFRDSVRRVEAEGS